MLTFIRTYCTGASSYTVFKVVNNAIIYGYLFTSGFYIVYVTSIRITFGLLDFETFAGVYAPPAGHF